VNQQPVRLTEEAAIRNTQQKVHVLALEAADNKKRRKTLQAIQPYPGSKFAAEPIFIRVARTSQRNLQKIAFGIAPRSTQGEYTLKPSFELGIS
jgi:hypothetical protein